MRFPDSLETHRRAFLDSLRVRGRSPATLQTYGLALGKFLAFLKKRRVRRLAALTPRLLHAYQDALADGAYRPASRAAWLGALRLFLKYLVDLPPSQGGRGAIRAPLAEAIVIPKVPDRLPRPILTPAEIRRLLDAPDPATGKGLRDRALLETLYSTGVRRAELIGLTLPDVDLAGGIARVNHGKGGRDRVVPLGQAAAEALQRYLEIRRRWTRTQPRQCALWLGANPPHRPLTVIGLGTILAGIARQAGLRRVSPHVLRHACATHLVSNGVNIALVQQLLGHRSLATTQIYTRVAVPDLVAMVRRSHPRP